MEFTADRTTIQPGESAVLSWAAENPGAMSITPDVGGVIARGSARVSPSATTTYTLSVGGGSNGETLTRTLTITVVGTTARPAATSAATTPRAVPRTADGRPFLQGVYNSFGARGTGRGRGTAPSAGGGAPNPAGRAAGAAGALPTQPTLKPGMEAYRAPTPDPNVIVSDCTVGSVPPSIGPYSVQFVQTDEYIVILYEYMHLFRIIRMDGQPHQPGVSWMGDSIGRWDGDTLVVDTVGFNLRSTTGGGGDRHQMYLHSDALHMVERIRRIDYDTLEWETTLEDPKVFEGPWRTTRRLAYHPELKKVEEYMCAENLKNYDYLTAPGTQGPGQR
jgi:hypothetical protein